MLTKINKLNIIHYIPLNLLLLIQATIVFQDSELYLSFPFDLIYSSLLLLIGTIVYLFSDKKKDSLIFLLMMIVTGWILILLHSDNRFFISIARIFMCLDTVLLYVFFAYFAKLDKKRLYKPLLLIQTIAAFITGGFLLTFIPIFSYSLFVLLLITISLCAALSFINQTSQRSFLREYQKHLLGAIVIALAPFILLRFFSHSATLIYLSFYSFISFPIVVAYVYLKKNKLQIEKDYHLLLASILFFFLVNGIFIWFCLSFIKINLVDSFTLLIFLYLLMYLYRYYQQYMMKKKIRFINSVKQTFEKERLEILQKITYDDYLNSLNHFVLQLIEKTIVLDGSMIIWKENQHRFTLNQTGIFKEMVLTKKLLQQLETVFNSIEIEGKIYLNFPLIYENNLCGWLITGNKADGYSFSKEEIEKMTLLSRTISEVFKTTEILHQTQKQYVALPNTNYDEHFNLNFLIKSDDMRRSLSHYLHDDVLQNILALKNLSEMLQTTQEKEKQLILETFQTLNESIREKMFDLYPSTLTDLSFYHSISILCEKTKDNPLAAKNLTIALVMDTELDIPTYLKFPIFRTIKELLHNALKHAQPKEIILTAEIQQSNILLIRVEDDGIGIDLTNYLDKKNNTSIGLLSIKQEINHLKGNFLIDNSREKGSAFQIELPIESERS